LLYCSRKYRGVVLPLLERDRCPMMAEAATACACCGGKAAARSSARAEGRRKEVAAGGIIAELQ
jgi:hypothetical protein